MGHWKGGALFSQRWLWGQRKDFIGGYPYAYINAVIQMAEVFNSNVSPARDSLEVDSST